MPDIECRTAESMVTKYINHSLSVDELEEFLDHISHCSSCYDELETYFIVHEAIQQLDEPEDGSVLDFRKLLDQDIRKSRRYIRKKRWFHFLTGLLLAVFAILLLIFIIFSEKGHVHLPPLFLIFHITFNFICIRTITFI